MKTREERNARKRERKRERYHSDPIFRAKERRSNRERKRERYHSDPVFRAKEIRRQLERNSDPIFRAKIRERYHSDPIFRAKRKAAMRKYSCKKKQADEYFQLMALGSEIEGKFSPRT